MVWNINYIPSMALVDFAIPSGDVTRRQLFPNIGKWCTSLAKTGIVGDDVCVSKNHVIIPLDVVFRHVQTSVTFCGLKKF